MILYGFDRSSASYRVRIALNLKGVDREDVYLDLLRGEQSQPSYRAINPQALVPVLVDDRLRLTQSLAIIEYLDEIYPAPPLLPSGAADRARARAFALAIACEIHPLQNLGTLRRLRGFGLDKQQVLTWAMQVIGEGLDACERMAEQSAGRFTVGDSVTLADVALVPQLSNARRYWSELRWPRLAAIEAACLEIDAFRAAAPDTP
ncbi:maleylacetoacetate isomerase [Sphingobium sp. EM0848]|uniref:maleylacetoacetate isomerase n=1 Tax=Sphingobium sp. EM0848 TaxID=2743473 RepID=UPI00159CB881|nr:maleylacetoacetate isomerase [Sphingobium sp. EM0848]